MSCHATTFMIPKLVWPGQGAAGHDGQEHGLQDSSKGGAVETGCSDLYAAMY